MFRFAWTFGGWLWEGALALLVAWILFFFNALLGISMFRFDSFFLVFFLTVYFFSLRHSAVFIAILVLLWSTFISLPLALTAIIACVCYGAYYLLRFRSISDQTARAFLLLLIVETIVFRTIIFALQLLNVPPQAIQPLWPNAAIVLLQDIGIMTLANVIVGILGYLLLHSLSRTWNRAFLIR